MPVFNGADYIRDSLDAVLGQTFTDFELVISDNASSDETESICRDYAARDPRNRYFRQERNIGALGNFEFVLNEARATYFMWVAADDLPSPNWIEHLFRNLGDSDFGVFGDYQYISESGQAEGAATTPRHLRRGSQLKVFMLPDTCGKCFYIYSLFRREPLASLRAFAEKPFLGNDQIIILRFLEGGDLRAVSGAVMKYRVHGANTSSNEGRQRGAYRRTLFSVFPAAYYRHAIDALPHGKRPMVFPLVPLKYLYEQARSYRAFLTLLARKVGDRVMNVTHLRRQRATHG